MKRKNRALDTFTFFLLAALLQACAANPLPYEPSDEDTTQDQEEIERDLTAVKILFHQSSFFGLTDPNENGCAGDAKTFHDALGLNLNGGSTLETLGSDSSTYVGETEYYAGNSDTLTAGKALPSPLPESETAPGTTLKPNFIKNISVDLTDTNASIDANQASSCSLSSDIVPTASCATFDYGAVGGVPTSLGGTVLMIGGIQGTNYSGIFPETSDHWSGGPDTVPVVQGLGASCGPIRLDDDLPSSSGGDPAIGRTSCSQSIYALAVDSIPASQIKEGNNPVAPGLESPPSSGEPVSSWANLGQTASFSSLLDEYPAGRVGPVLGYSANEQKAVLFGGSSVIEGYESEGLAADTTETWVYDLKNQSWLKLNTVVSAAQSILTQTDVDANSVTRLVSHTTGARAYFGMAAAARTSLSAYNADGSANDSNLSPVENVFVTGGITSEEAYLRTTKFNPTFGPELLDAVGIDITNGSGVAAASGATVYWAHTYPTRVVSNGRIAQGTATYYYDPTDLSSAIYDNQDFFSPFMPHYPSRTNPTDATQFFLQGAQAMAFGFLGWVSESSTATPGYLLSAGGFDPAIPRINDASASWWENYCDDESGAGDDDDGSDDICKGGELLFSKRVVQEKIHNDTHAIDDATDMQRANTDSLGMTASFVSNLPDGTRVAPVIWERIAETDTGAIDTTQLPWFGGVSFQRGFGEDDVVYFGGSPCTNFLLDTTATAECDLTTATVRNPGRYFDLASEVGEFTGRTPSARPSLNDSISVNNSDPHSLIADDTQSTPFAAGMASARGFTVLNGSISPIPIVIAFGGMQGNSDHSDTHLRVLYDDSTAGVTPRWSVAKASTSSESIEALAAASMVYSRVTGKFYLFGGYMGEGSVGSRGDTWELTVQQDEALSTTTKFSYTWRKLNSDGSSSGLTCSPSCPTARRGHQMIEAAYQSDGTLTARGCEDRDTPCSMMIFMEGGTPDGASLFNERWTFDPTANGGRGHWQKVDDFPARRLAAASTVSFTPNNSPTRNYLVMFGGEMGLGTPSSARSDGFFVPPTLGDTLIFDFTTQTWNRMKILGIGYEGAQPSSATEEELRQSFIRNTGSNTILRMRNSSTVSGFPAPDIAELAPPPLSGAMMVTRTFPSPLKDASTPVSPLKIPEIFLFGGRTLDGKPIPLDHVYKLCVASGGEHLQNSSISADTDTAECDAYDSEKNPDSPFPSTEYVGRWIRKVPDNNDDLDEEFLGAYAGAAAYDPYFDRIVLFGGITGDAISAPPAVTSSSRSASSALYEYTPPSKVDVAAGGTSYHGKWTEIPTCSLSSGTMDTPTARYGHSMNYDTVQNQMIIVGGYSIDGTALTQEYTPDVPGTTTYTLPEVWIAKKIEKAGPVSAIDTTEISESSTSFPCYYFKKKTVFGNNPEILASAPPTQGLSHSASVYLPATGYNTGYYTLQDQFCTDQGPFAVGDSRISKQFAGGAYIDLDRSALGEYENLILNLTYIPLGTQNRRPDGIAYTDAESAVFKVHLVATGSSDSDLQRVTQPRHLHYANEDDFPQVAKTISVLAPPTGEPRQDQIFIPIAGQPEIDRIRIERVQGSAILIDAAVFRTKSP